MAQPSEKEKSQAFVKVITLCVEHSHRCTDPDCVTARAGVQFEAAFKRFGEELIKFGERYLS